MSEHEKRLRAVLQALMGVVPKLGREAFDHLEALLTEQRTTGLDDAMGFFTKKQKDLDQKRVAAKSLSNSEIADLKTEAGRAGWAAQQLRMEKGRRKKGKEKAE